MCGVGWWNREDELRVRAVRGMEGIPNPVDDLADPLCGLCTHPIVEIADRGVLRLSFRPRAGKPLDILHARGVVIRPVPGAFAFPPAMRAGVQEPVAGTTQGMTDDEWERAERCSQRTLLEAKTGCFKGEPVGYVPVRIMQPPCLSRFAAIRRAREAKAFQRLDEVHEIARRGWLAVATGYAYSRGRDAHQRHIDAVPDGAGEPVKRSRVNGKALEIDLLEEGFD